MASVQPVQALARRSVLVAGSCARQQHNLGAKIRSHRHRSTIRARAEEPDVQVFRFTLGIPGFDDSNIPAVVGAVGAVILAWNHTNSYEPLAAAQTRGEAIALALLLLCITLPWLEKRLAAATGGTGRRAAGTVDGSTTAFVFDQGLPDIVTKELAWAAYTCLRNTNICTMLVLKQGKVALARGAIASSCAQGSDAVGKPTLADVDTSVQRDMGCQESSTALPENGLYLRNKQQMQQSPYGKWGCVPSECGSALIMPLSSGSSSLLFVISEVEDGLPQKDLQWLRNVARKLRRVFEK